MRNSNVHSCSDTEGDKYDKYDDARNQIDDNWTAASNSVQVEQRVSVNEIQVTATKKTVDVTMTDTTSKANDNTVVPDENVVTPEEKL